MPCCAYSCQAVGRAAPDTESARARAEAGAKVRGQVEPTALRYYLMLGTTVLVVACGICKPKPEPKLLLLLPIVVFTIVVAA